jgi:hypothetical protein
MDVSEQSHADQTSMRVPGFLPSTSGFHFGNGFPPGPVFRVGVARASLPFGNAANGLCGGMTYAVRDLFEAGLPPPTDRSPPAGGTPLFQYVGRRLISSWALPLGSLRYLWWSMLPSEDGRLGLFRVRGLHRRSVEDQWPRVRADLEARKLAPLGLIRIRSFNPLRVGRNHQVLAFGYDLDSGSGRLSIHVYDPNHPDDDALTLALDTRLPPAGPDMAYLPGEDAVRGFFRTRYRRKDPRGAVGTATRGSGVG